MNGDFAAKSRWNYFATDRHETIFNCHMNNFGTIIENKVDFFIIKNEFTTFKNVKSGVQTIALPAPDNCPLGDCSRGNCPLPGQLLPRIIAPGWLHPDYYSQTITINIIAPWQYPPGNCPRGKLPFRWFVACIIVPRTNGPEKNCRQENSFKDKLHPRYFFLKNQKS